MNFNSVVRKWYTNLLFTAPTNVPYLKDRPCLPESSGQGFPHYLAPPRENFPYCVNAKDIGELLNYKRMRVLQVQFLDLIFQSFESYINSLDE